MEFCRHRFIFLEIRVKKNSVRAKPKSFLAVHRGMYAVLSRFIITGAHHSSLRRFGSDNQSFPGKSGVVPYLHGGIEGIHIHVEDSSHLCCNPAYLSYSFLYFYLVLHLRFFLYFPFTLLFFHLHISLYFNANICFNQFLFI